MKTEKKSISLPSALLAKAEQRVIDEHYSGLSDYIQELIRRDLHAHSVSEPVNYSVLHEKPAKPIKHKPSQNHRAPDPMEEDGTTP